MTALLAAVFGALGAFATNWFLETRKRLLDVRMRAYEDFLTAMALPARTPEELATRNARLLGAKARAALFGSVAVVESLKRHPAESSAEAIASVLAAMRSDLVTTVEEGSDGETLLRAVFGPQDGARRLPSDVPGPSVQRPAPPT